MYLGLEAVQSPCRGARGYAGHYRTAQQRRTNQRRKNIVRLLIMAAHPGLWRYAAVSLLGYSKNSLVRYGLVGRAHRNTNGIVILNSHVIG